MSAETIENQPLSPLDQPEAAGALAMNGTVSPLEMVVPDKAVLLTPAKGDISIRGRSQAATLMKEKFQAVTGETGDERDSQRLRAREQSVRLMFRTFGMLDKDTADNGFSKLYTETEDRITNVSAEERLALWDRIGELWDASADHPVMQTLDSLRGMSTVDPEDILFMRRTALLLIADYSGA